MSGHKPYNKGKTIRAKILNMIIVRKMSTGGECPTIREIQEEMGFSSTSVVSFHLDKMQEAGMIRLIDGNIRIPGESWKPPTWWHTGADVFYIEENSRKHLIARAVEVR